MKKYLFTGGLLAALAVAMVLGAQAWINDMQDDVTYKETVLFGNKTWAKDITVDSKIQSVHKNLHWDIRFKIGGAKGKVTDSKANFSLKNMGYRKDYDLYIDEDQFGYSTYTETDGSVDLPGKEPLRSMVNAVAAKTEPEKTGTEVLQLSDYCSTLPLNIFYSGNNLSSYVNQDISAEKYFSIPVSDDYQVTVSVTKNRKGKLKGYSISNYSACVENVSATAKEGCYVAFTMINPRGKIRGNRTSKDNFSIPEEVNGIHLIPYDDVTKKSQVKLLDFPKGKKVYPLESHVRTLGLSVSEDNQKLFLVTREGGNIYLSVIDIDSYKCLSKVYLRKDSPKKDAMITVLEIANKGEDAAVFFSDCEFSLAVKENDGETYKLEMTGLLKADESTEDAYITKKISPLIGFGNLDFDYDGEKLALLTEGDGYSKYYNLLFIFTKDGTKFIGKYVPTNEPERSDTSNIGADLVNKPLTVTLKAKGKES